MNSKYCAFITLTYNPESLPTVRVSTDKVDYLGHRGCDRVNFELLDNNKLSKRYAGRVKKYYGQGKVDSFVLSPNPYYDLKRFLLPLQSGKFGLSEPNTFGFLFRPDLQNFLKRLRYYIKKDYDKNCKQTPLLRFFAVGEYGPVSFRPHYHALLFFDDDTLPEKISMFVRKSWQFGRIDCQMSGSNGVADYCASYLNSVVRSPKILQLSWNRSFVLHSPHFGEKPFNAVVQGVESLTYENLGSRVLGIDGKCRDIASPVSFQNNVFPKCYGYGVSDDYINLGRYRLYETLYKFFGETGVRRYPLTISEYCNMCMVAIGVVCRGELHLFNEPTRKLFILVYEKLSVLFGEEKIQEGGFYGTLLRSLYLSKRFIVLCDTFAVSHWYYYFKVIKSFYEDKDASNFTRFLQQTAEDAPLIDLRYIISEYGNLPKFDGSQSFKEYIESNPVIESFADSVGCTPYEVVDAFVHYDDDPRYIYDYDKQHQISASHVKHKKLNDLNKIFL